MSDSTLAKSDPKDGCPTMRRMVAIVRYTVKSPYRLNLAATITVPTAERYTWWWCWWRRCHENIVSMPNEVSV